MMERSAAIFVLLRREWRPSRSFVLIKKVVEYDTHPGSISLVICQRCVSSGSLIVGVPRLASRAGTP